MRYSVFVFLLCSLTLLNYCGSEKGEKSKTGTTIFANFEVRYLEQEKELRGLATFKAGSAQNNAQNIQLQEVSFQNKAMKLQNLGERGFRYIHTQRGAYSDKFIFHFKNQTDKNLDFEVSMPPVGDFSIQEGTVQKSKGITIDWTGEALDSHKNLILMFTDSLQKAASTFVKGPTKDSEVFIPAKDLSSLTIGQGQLYLVKKQLLPYRKEHLSVQSLIEFYTNTINIEVIE